MKFFRRHICFCFLAFVSIFFLNGRSERGSSFLETGHIENFILISNNVNIGFNIYLERMQIS
jgi:hypothetical protein